MAEHHLPDELLLAYAAGTASEAHALLCAVHLTSCDRCRAEVALLEQVGGALLAAAPVHGDGAPTQARAAAVALDGELPPGAEAWPRALHPYVRGRRWRWFAPGTHVLTTALQVGDLPVRLFRLAARQVVPRHTHLGDELTLVLSGGYTDRGAHYGPGDVAAHDATVTHALHIDADGPCVTLVVNEHPLVPRSLRARVLARLRRP